MIEQHLFGPKSKNAFINSERKRIFCRYEDGNAHGIFYKLPVVTGGTKSQEGGEIARDCIEDPKVYRGTSMPQ